MPGPHLTFATIQFHRGTVILVKKYLLASKEPSLKIPEMQIRILGTGSYFMFPIHKRREE
jgi:hypothetical protein